MDDMLLASMEPEAEADRSLEHVTALRAAVEAVLGDPARTDHATRLFDLVVRGLDHWVATPTEKGSHALHLHEYALIPLSYAFVRACETRNTPVRRVAVTDRMLDSEVDRMHALSRDAAWVGALSSAGTLARVAHMVYPVVNAIDANQQALDPARVFRYMCASVHFTAWTAAACSIRVMAGPPASPASPISLAAADEPPPQKHAKVAALLRAPPAKLPAYANNLFVDVCMPPDTIPTFKRNNDVADFDIVQLANQPGVLTRVEKEQIAYCQERFDGAHWVTDEDMAARRNAEAVESIEYADPASVIANRASVPIDFIARLARARIDAATERNETRLPTEAQRAFYEDCYELAAWGMVLDACFVDGMHPVPPGLQLPYAFSLLVARPSQLGLASGTAIATCAPMQGGLRRLPSVTILCAGLYACFCPVCLRATLHTRATPALARWAQCLAACHNHRDAYDIAIKL